MNRLSLPFILLLVVVLFTAASSQPTLSNESQKAMVRSNLASMPLAFTENRGQWDEKALFKAEAGGATFWFCKDEVVYQFMRDTNELIEDGMSNGPKMPDGMPDKFNHPRYKKEEMVLRAQFVGANLNPEITGTDRLSHNCNYFLGNIPSKWATDVPNYSSITYKDIYPGIDLKYHGDDKGMKYDFIVNPGADISRIRIKYDGVENLSVTNQGDLEAQTKFGPVSERIPQIYQEIGGQRREISGYYILLESGVFGFTLEEGFNPAYPVVIDPELVYSTYLGGNGDDGGEGIAVDGSGNAYVIGITSSSDFPTVSPYDGSYNGGYDVFVARLSPSGNSLIFSTYLGGSGPDEGFGIALDGSGNAYVTGRTSSSDFPTVYPYDGSFNGIEDAFVARLSSSGNSLIYSTYLGGSRYDQVVGIALDGSGNAYVTGYTESSDFPAVNPYDGNLNGGTDAFVARLSSSGNSLIYSTYLGGSDNDYGFAIALDGSGNAYVTGCTCSSDFPTVNPYDGSFNGFVDAFVARLSPSGNSLIYSTYLGGSDYDAGLGIALDGSGNAYVTGFTESSNFPTISPYDGSFNGGWDAFVARLSASGNSLIYSTYLGGSSNELGCGIALDGSGNAYVTGYTESSNFPTVYPYDGSFNGGRDAFVARLSASGNSLIYSTYLGGSDYDWGTGIALDGSGNAYVTGTTQSSNFPTVNPYDGSLNGIGGAFVARFVPGGIYIPGNVNGQGGFNGLDVVYAVAYLKGGPPPDCLYECTPGHSWYVCGDVNASCSYNGLDVSYMVAFLKGLGPAPAPCPDCPPAR